MTKLKGEIFDRVNADLRARKHKGQLVDIIQFIEDPYYLGSRGISLDRLKHQMIVLKAFYGLTLEQWEKTWLLKLKKEGRTNWEEGVEYRQLLEEVGQRCAKTFTGGIICAYEAYKWMETPEPWITVPTENGGQVITKGSPVEIKMVAKSKDNAMKHIFYEAKAFVKSSPYFQGKFNYDKHAKKMEITFPEYDLFMEAGPSSSGSLRGGTGLVALLDELDHWTDTASSIGADEIKRALENTLSTLMGRLYILTSPVTVDSPGWRLFKSAISGETSGLLVINADTFMMDPTQKDTDPFFINKRSNDPEGYERDFLAKPTAAVAPFIRVPDWLDKIFVFDPPGNIDPPGELVTPEKEEKKYLEMLEYVLSGKYPVLRGCRYVLSGDPAETNDAFGLTLSHLSPCKQHIDIDLSIRFIPPSAYGVSGEIDASLVTPLIIALCRKFKPVYITDKFGWTELRQQVKRVGCKVKEKNMELSIAIDARMAMYCAGPYHEGHDRYDGQLVRMYMCPQLRKELLGMELILEKRIEYPRKPGQCGHGDMAITFINCVAELYDPRTMSKIKEFDAPWNKALSPKMG